MCDVSFLTKTFAPCESETAAVPSVQLSAAT